MVGSILLLLEDIEVREAGSWGGWEAVGLEEAILLSSSSWALAHGSRLLVAETGEAEADTEG